jgi:4-hydroxy-tetrahydrodipicolinate reductase
MTSTSPIQLLVHGAQGKMGARIAALARDDARFMLIAAHDVDDRDRAAAIEPGSISAIIDFSSDSGAQHAAHLARTHRAALLVGTTGLSRKSLEMIEESARFAPVMIAPNTSLGVAVLSHLIAQAARLLGPDFDIDIIEAHHTMKRDAPSGTALRLQRSLRENAGVDLPAERIHAIRAGDIVGEHTVEFSGPGERLKFSHFATNRDLFARGALRAMAWLHGKAPGSYTIEQSLSLGKP